MFTGIIETIGTVDSVTDFKDSSRITISAPTILEDAHHGDSISVNGCCLTIVEFDDKQFSADVMDESLKRTNLGELKAGSVVNLERAVRVDQRLGGHIVQGHVDAVGTLVGREPSENWEIFSFSAPKEVLRYLVEKGSITVNGVSLTVVSLTDSGFSVSLIPTTLTDTVLGSLSIGAQVNLEVDVLAKYIERLLP